MEGPLPDFLAKVELDQSEAEREDRQTLGGNGIRNFHEGSTQFLLECAWLGWRVAKERMNKRVRAETSQIAKTKAASGLLAFRKA